MKKEKVYVEVCPKCEHKTAFVKETRRGGYSAITETSWSVFICLSCGGEFREGVFGNEN